MALKTEDAQQTQELTDDEKDAALSTVVQKVGKEVVDAVMKALGDAEDDAKKSKEFFTDSIIDQYAIGAKVVADFFNGKATPDLKELRKRIDKAYEDLGRGYEDGYTGQLEGTVDVGASTQLQMITNGKARDAIQAATERNAKGTLKTLAERGIFAFKSTATKTADDIMRVVQRGLENNETIAKISSNIQKLARDVLPSRADTIARTETLTAFSIGQAATAEVANELIPGMKKVWMPGDDNRVRGRPGGLYENSEADHWVLRGESRDMKEKFSNGLRFPRDPQSQKANEVINCRCTFLMVQPENLDQIVERIGV